MIAAEIMSLNGKLNCTYRWLKCVYRLRISQEYLDINLKNDFSSYLIRKLYKNSILVVIDCVNEPVNCKAIFSDWLTIMYYHDNAEDQKSNLQEPIYGTFFKKFVPHALSVTSLEDIRVRLIANESRIQDLSKKILAMSSQAPDRHCDELLKMLYKATSELSHLRQTLDV